MVHSGLNLHPNTHQNTQARLHFYFSGILLLLTYVALLTYVNVVNNDLKIYILQFLMYSNREVR